MVCLLTGRGLAGAALVNAQLLRKAAAAADCQMPPSAEDEREFQNEELTFSKERERTNKGTSEQFTINPPLPSRLPPRSGREHSSLLTPHS